VLACMARAAVGLVRRSSVPPSAVSTTTRYTIAQILKLSRIRQ
jgi:hypothetical protein